MCLKIFHDSQPPLRGHGQSTPADYPQSAVKGMPQAPPRWFDSPVFQVDGVTFVRHVTGHESQRLPVQRLAVITAVDSAWSLVREEVAAINASSIGRLVGHSSMRNT